MTDTSQLLNKILSVPKDNMLYLIEKFPGNTGLFASNGNVLYMVLNDESCPYMNVKTDFLNLHTNIFVSAFNSSAPSFESGYYNSVELLLTEPNDREANLSAFINLCLAHSTYMKGQNFISFFDSLVSLFQLPREQQYKNLVGLMGELLLMEYIYLNFKEDLSQYWHVGGVSSRLDFTCPYANFEVKATTTDSQSFTVKHNQLFVNSEKNYLVTVSIEENNSGCTLEEIITRMLKDSNYCNNLRFSVNVEKEKRRVSPSEINSRRFVLKKINAYHATDINPFVNVPNCIEDLSYKLNLLPFSTTSFLEILSKR